MQTGMVKNQVPTYCFFFFILTHSLTLVIGTLGFTCKVLPVDLDKLNLKPRLTRSTNKGKI